VTRRRADLRAVLDTTREQILCGRCGAQLGRIVSSRVDGSMRVPLLPLTFGVKVVATGPGTFTEGPWRRLRRADAAEREDRPTSSRRALPGDGGFGRPPDGYIPLKVGAQIDCPSCDARQTLDDHALALDFDRKHQASPHLGSIPWWDDLA